MARPKKQANAKGDAQWTQERLLDAAEHLFARRGFEATSLREIGKAVGVSNATLLHHFGSKRDLYRAVLDRLALALRSLLEASVGDAAEPPLPALLRFVRRFSNWTRQNPNYGYIAFREFMEKTVLGSELDFRLESEVFAEMKSLIRRGQRDGTFRTDVDVETFIVQLLTTVWIGEISVETWERIVGAETPAFRGHFRDHAIVHLMRGLVADVSRLADTESELEEPEALQ